MTVTETLQGLGGWDLTLSGLPREIGDKLQYFGHIAIHSGRVDYRVQGDAALTSARYVGVIQKSDAEGETFEVGGPGMASWLGDADQKGSVIETPIVFSNSNFDDAIRALLPSSGAVTEGTIFNLAETYSGSFVFQSPREAIDYVCETVGAEWRVNGNATLDAGLVTDLFVTNPKTLISRRFQGADMQLRSFLGDGKASQDVADFSTRVLLLAMGTEASTVTAAADINPLLNPFVDLHGNPVELTRLVSESTTDSTNAPARAQLQMNRFSGSTDALKLSTSDYDVKGDIAVGDYAWVFDDEIGLQDTANEIIFEGFRCNPMKLRMIEITFPITNQMAVGYRDPSGQWWNLTDYIVPETGATTLVVGDYKKSLSGADGGVIGSRPQPDTSVPDVPTWVTPFTQSIYQNLRGDTRAQAQLTWLRPGNTDGSSISDGDHYEIRYRQASTPLFPVTWAQLAGFQWNALGTWDNPIQYTPGEWQYVYVPWSQLDFLIIDLLPNMPYEAQIRAVDGATPANFGDWSSTTSWQTNGDIIPPTQPAAPTVYASRIAVQVVHELGKISGGTYNLELDLHHFEVHGEYEPNFTPTEATLLGKIIANAGMITGHIPAIGTVPIESVAPVYFKVIAVDNDGNQSLPSMAVQQTAELIDDAHISNLTVTKITAGTITSDWIMGASIKTGLTGARAELDAHGFRLYDVNDVNTVNLDADDGSAFFQGTMQSGSGAQRIVVNPNPTGIARIDMFDDASTNHTTLVQFGTNFVMQLEANSDRSVQGGKLQFGTGTSIFGHVSGGNEAFIALGSDEGIQVKGYWAATTIAGHSAIVVGHDDAIAAGLGNVSYGYGATMVDRSNPLGHAYSSEGPWAGYPTMSPTSTGFLVRLPATAAVKGFHWWVYRSL